MADYEPMPERMLVAPNPGAVGAAFPDPLLSGLDTLEIRSALAIEPEPGQTYPAQRDNAVVLRGSGDVEAVIRASSVEPGHTFALVLDTRNRLLHLVAGPAVDTVGEANDALRSILAVTVLGGGSHFLLVRYDAFPGPGTGWGSGPTLDTPLLNLLQSVRRAGTLPLQMLDFLWIEPDGRALSAVDAGVWDPSSAP